MDVQSAVGEASVHETAQKWSRSASYWELLV